MVAHSICAFCCRARLYKVWLARQYPAYASNTLLLDNSLAAMGAGVPSAMAAKLVNPDVRCRTASGTGYTAQGIPTEQRVCSASWNGSRAAVLWLGEGSVSLGFRV